MGAGRTFGSLFLILLSFIAFFGLSSEAVQLNVERNEIYDVPQGVAWGNFGTHDNTLSNVDNQLVIENIDQTGYFYGETKEYDGIISLNNVEIDAYKPNENIQDIYFNITFYDELDNELQSERIEIQNGQNTYPVDGFNTSGAHSFDYSLELSGDQSSPALNSLEVDLTITDDTFSKGIPKEFNTLIFMTMFFLGLAGLILN